MPKQDTGVEAIFWSQWQEHQDYLYRCYLKGLGNSTDAQDALSEAMLKAWDKIRTSAKPIQNIKAEIPHIFIYLHGYLHSQRDLYEKPSF